MQDQERNLDPPHPEVNLPKTKTRKDETRAVLPREVPAVKSPRLGARKAAGVRKLLSKKSFKSENFLALN